MLHRLPNGGSLKLCMSLKVRGWSPQTCSERVKSQLLLSLTQRFIGCLTAGRDLLALISNWEQEHLSSSPTAGQTTAVHV